MMSRHHRRIPSTLAGTTLLCLLVGVYLFASKRFTKKDPSSGISRRKVETPADEALKYWTADKMRKAKGAPLPNVDALERAEEPPRRPARPSDPRQA